MDRGVPSLDRGLTARSDRRLRGGRQSEFLFRRGRQEVTAYHHERCLIFRQFANQELTKTVRLTAKITFKYKRNCYQMQSAK